MNQNNKRSTKSAQNAGNQLNDALMQHGRIPPQAIDLEEVVLGAMMLEKDAVNAIIDILKPEVFYKEAHQKIFTAIFCKTNGF